MTRLKKTIGLVEVFVLFPIAVFVAIAIAFAVSLEALAIYVGALLSAWLLFAYVLPMLTGVMTPGEVHANIRSRTRNQREFEGESLDLGSALWRSRTKEPDQPAFEPFE